MSWVLVVGAMSVYGWQDYPIQPYKDAPASVRFVTLEACQIAGAAEVKRITGDGPSTWEYQGVTLPIAAYHCEPLT
jgi:hypothetical protein